MSWRFKLNHSAEQHHETGVPEMLLEMWEAIGCVYKFQRELL
jgi:hypothetical protein